MDPGGAAPETSRREALSKALLEEGDRLYALALRVTRDPDLAADAVQEAFATALERESGFRGESSLATWLHRIVFTKAIDLLRRRGREGPLPEDDPEARPPQGGDMGRAPSWARPPDALLLGKETRVALEKALGALTPAQRAIFELKEAEGRPTEEVAAILGMPPGTVRVHLHRARLKLRSLLGEHFRRGRT
ncbi:MAG TPA: RNA polymerase sigma factor [Vicinamibacteria bacterium]|jgi:RNA polymerase sigma-70 factor (ECF subfamily)|nr:RNA polymerase sigma factor [Vicinamibacteria bacterium]